jgi:hypothetical protein
LVLSQAKHTLSAGCASLMNNYGIRTGSVSRI